MNLFSSHPRTFALSAFLLIQLAIGTLYYLSEPHNDFFEATEESGSNIAPTARSSSPVDANIQTSRLVAYDVSQAAYQIESRRDVDLFDSYVSLYLPSNPAPQDLFAIRTAILNLNQTPLSNQNYPYHIKLSFCEFYRFCLIPVLHFQKSRTLDLSAEELLETGNSLRSALQHSKMAGASLSLIETKLEDISRQVETPSGTLDRQKLNNYFQGKSALLRQIL